MRRERPHIDWQAIQAIKNDPALTEREKERAAYKLVWGVSFTADILIRVGAALLVVVGLVLILLLAH